MIEDFKKWLCKKAGLKDWIANIKFENEILPLEILIKAMWTINRESDISYSIINYEERFAVAKIGTRCLEYFDFRKYNDSEQQALEAVLKYIFDKEKE